VLNTNLAIKTTTVNGYHNGRSGGFFFYKSGHVVYCTFTGILSASSASAPNQITDSSGGTAIIPEDYRPIREVNVAVNPVSNNTVNNTARFKYLSNGQIQFLAEGTSSFEYSHAISWIAN
jgi:hypothetical protein